MQELDDLLDVVGVLPRQRGAGDRVAADEGAGGRDPGAVLPRTRRANSMPKTQLTIRGIDGELKLRLRRLAAEREISLNKAALVLMRRGAGLETQNAQPDVVGNSLNHLMGVWSEEEAADFREATSDFDRIDEALWA